jgi:hypothetical protein
MYSVLLQRNASYLWLSLYESKPIFEVFPTFGTNSIAEAKLLVLFVVLGI